MFGLGKIKFMPGTFGSLATTIFLFYLFHSLNISSNVILFGLIIIFIYSFYAVSTHIEANKNKDTKVKSSLQNDSRDRAANDSKS